MHKGEIRILEMLVRVRQFVLSRIAAFVIQPPVHFSAGIGLARCAQA